MDSSVRTSRISRISNIIPCFGENGKNSPIEAYTQEKRRTIIEFNPEEMKRVAHKASLLNGIKDGTEAVSFDVRAEMDIKQTLKILDRRSHEYLQQAIDESTAESTVRSKHSECWIRFEDLCRSSSAARVLRLMAYFTSYVAPFLLAFEPACELAEERSRMAVLKIMHLCFTVIYLASSAMVTWMSNRSGHGTQWSAVDILVLLALIAEFGHVAEQPVGLPTSFQWMWLLNVSKLWRSWTSNAATTHYGFVLQMVCLLIKFTFFVHIASCVFGLMAQFERHHGQSTWADDIFPDGEPRSCTDFYVYSMYFTAYTATSVGYGDVVPVNSLERIAVTFWMILSQLYMAQVFADLNFINQLFTYWESKHHQKRTLASTALTNIGAPAVLRQRVLAYQDYSYEVRREWGAEEVFSDMPTVLKEELDVFLNYSLVIKVPFLQFLSRRALRKIVSSLKSDTFLPSDFIIRPGDDGNDLFFMRDGAAAVFVTEHAPQWLDPPVRIMRQGTYFGEVALMTGQPRSSWVMARAYCICLMLSKQTIDEVIDNDPTCLAKLVGSMKEYLGLQPQLTWHDIVLRLAFEFQTEEDAYEYICSGADGEGPAGSITWKRYKTLMLRLNVSAYDQKLLWADMCTVQDSYEFTFEDFLDVLDEDVWGEAEAEEPQAPAISMMHRRKSNTSNASQLSRNSASRSRNLLPESLTNQVGAISGRQISEESLGSSCPDLRQDDSPERDLSKPSLARTDSIRKQLSSSLLSVDNQSPNRGFASLAEIPMFPQAQALKDLAAARMSGLKIMDIEERNQGAKPRLRRPSDTSAWAKAPAAAGDISPRTPTLPSYLASSHAMVQAFEANGDGVVSSTSKQGEGDTKTARPSLLRKASRNQSIERLRPAESEEQTFRRRARSKTSNELGQRPISRAGSRSKSHFVSGQWDRVARQMDFLTSVVEDLVKQVTAVRARLDIDMPVAQSFHSENSQHWEIEAVTAPGEIVPRITTITSADVKDLPIQDNRLNHGVSAFERPESFSLDEAGSAQSLQTSSAWNRPPAESSTRLD